MKNAHLISDRGNRVTIAIDNKETGYTDVRDVNVVQRNQDYIVVSDDGGKTTLIHREDGDVIRFL